MLPGAEDGALMEVDEGRRCLSSVFLRIYYEMYTTLLYFIVVFALYSLYEQPATPRLTEREFVVAVLIGYALFYATTAAAFGRLVSRYNHGKYSAQTFSTLHARCLNWCVTTGIALFAVYVYVLDMPYYFTTALSLSPDGFGYALAGIAVFFLFLLIAWGTAFPSYRRFYHPEARASTYIGSHVRIAISIVLPWLFYAAILDAVRLFPEPFATLLQESTAAQYALLAMTMIAAGLVYPRILVRLWNCRPLPHGPLRSGLESFCRAAKFRFADIMVWDLFDGKLITAGVLGIIPQARYLLISPSLLKLLDQQEIEAVMAHEIGHVRHRHLLFYGAFVLGYLLVAYVFWAVLSRMLLSAESIADVLITPDGRFSPLASIGTGGVSVMLLLLYFRGLFGYFSRNFERQADGFAVTLTGTGMGIASSLEKIASASALSRTAPNWHHFGIQERIDYIMRCTAYPSLVGRHDRMVRRMVGGYLAALCAVAVVVLGMHDKLVGGAQMSLVQRIAEKKVAIEPGNASLHLLLANIYFEQGRYESAERHYLEVLTLDPENPEALNNLAWMYATARDRRFRNPREALRLARKAAQRDPQPHILDTLAESYFVNGDYQSAIETIRLAIEQNPADIAYYKKQLKKFEDHMRSAAREPELRSGEDDERIAL